jgi:hypothetical protein
MSKDKLYELRRDIWTPAYYIRAGFRKTEKEWKERLGEFNMNCESDWFIDCSEKKEQREVDELYELIKSVFHKKGLFSISYKEAAKEVAELWLKQNQKP